MNDSSQQLFEYHLNGTREKPYAVGLTVDDGTRFEKQVDVAVQSIQPTAEMISYFALIGTYVGILPVLIGLLWFPFISKLSRSKYKFFLALTVGLLLFPWN